MFFWILCTRYCMCIYRYNVYDTVLYVYIDFMVWKQQKCFCDFACKRSETFVYPLSDLPCHVAGTFVCLQDAALSYDPESLPGEVQSDVVFREGQTLGGHVTHTPRLIAMDLKGDLRIEDLGFCFTNLLKIQLHTVTTCRMHVMDFNPNLHLIFCF